MHDARAGRHELLVGDPLDPHGATGSYVAPVLEALGAGWEVLLHAEDAVEQQVLEALGGSTPHLHLMGAAGGDARAAEVLDDLHVQTDLTAAGGARVQSVRQVRPRTPEGWWDWSRVEAAYDVVLPHVWHVCGYDLVTMDRDRALDVWATHPWVREAGVVRRNPAWRDPRDFLRGRLAHPATLRGRPPDLDVLAPLAAVAVEQVRGVVAGEVEAADVVALDLAVRVVATEVLARTGSAARLGVWLGATACHVVVADGAAPGGADAVPRDELVGLVPDGSDLPAFLAHCAVDVEHVVWQGRPAVRLSLPR